MTETQKRIEAYKKALPEIRERVIAVALLFAMSMAMMTSATFAWLTISRAPEVTAVNTTVAANGNLEIALATGDGTIAPGESQVGDSSANEEQSVTRANITWGNLVNLSDPSYGLDNLTLRPAQLNTASLLDSPLFGADYDEDGRIVQLSSNYAYTSWVPPEGEKPGYFGVPEDGEGYGVRAISSTKIEAVGAAEKFYKMVDAASSANSLAGSKYVALGSNDKYMPSLATMMGLYMTARMNPDHATLSNPECKIADIQNLRDMYAAFLECFDTEADAMAKIVNIYLFLESSDGSYEPYTAEDIYATPSAELKEVGIQITKLDQFKADRNIIASDLEKLKEICDNGENVKWKDSGLNGIVNNLVNVGACTIGKDNTPISSIGASNAMGYLSGTQEARITNGILYRFEERVGAYIEVKNLGISATVNRLGMTIPATVKANIQTTASRDYNHFTNDLNFAKSKNTGQYQGGIPVAQDTYGLAIDLWVRTNAESSYLTLEGNVVAETEMVRAYGEDINGNKVELYTATVQIPGENGETVSQNIDVYKDEDENWYIAENYQEISTGDMSGDPIPKMVEQEKIIGYEGENRVWGDNALLTADSTTQGSGSCYVYYADTPEDQARSLKLLEAFNVAFIGADGKLMATAVMDTERFYAESGRVIVPLVLSSSDSINLGEDYEGDVTYAITPLQKNVPTRVTAIVYIDGQKLTNKEVLSVSEIQGKLNIQFGSSESMNPIKNEDLESKELRVSASVTPNSFDFDTVTEPMKSKVTVHIDGDAPSTVTAFFMRAISSTQGSREELMTFTDNQNGDWVSDYTFKYPGNYILRTVMLDGVDHDLSVPQTVTITGFNVAELKWDQPEGSRTEILTADGSTTINLYMKFAADDASKMPTAVQGRFLREDGNAVNVDFVKESGDTWSGKATFFSSGEYTMQYLVLDGEYFELAEEFRKTADITLGLRVAVYPNGPTRIGYTGIETEEQLEEKSIMPVQVSIMDDTGEPIPGLTNVWLNYGKERSVTQELAGGELTWNGTYYVGNLINTKEADVGVWRFKSVTVGGSSLTNAETAPVYIISSIDPSVYYNAPGTALKQYAPENNARMGVYITNTAALSNENEDGTQGSYPIMARIAKLDDERKPIGEGTWVNVSQKAGELEDPRGTYLWYFTIPTDQSTKTQDGEWQLLAIKIWDVYDIEGTLRTKNNPAVYDLSEESITTKVVCTVTPVFEAGQTFNLGKDASGNVTGTFMENHGVSGLKVKFVNYMGEQITSDYGIVIKDVSLTFNYKNGSYAEYGNFTSANAFTNIDATQTIALADGDGNYEFVQSSAAEFKYAGSYGTKFTYTVQNKIVNYGDTNGDGIISDNESTLDNMPVITVSSKAPTVTIASISPNGPHKTLNLSTEEEENVTSKIVDNYTVEIYSDSQKSGSRNFVLNTYPQVTLSVDKGAATKATLTFVEENGDKVRLYTREREGQTDSFIWESDTTCKRFVGNFQEGGTCRGATMEGAGTLKASELILEYDGATYKFAIPEITITNIR
ncbi:MAG: hypothetical protein IJM98_00810 [Oscillospiraceae bacterium]|nr:hypothetical protein [Oscillospiraceae bacterium]